MYFTLWYCDIDLWEKTLVHDTLEGMNVARQTAAKTIQGYQEYQSFIDIYL